MCCLGDDFGTLVVSDSQNNTLRFLVPPSSSFHGDNDTEPRVQSLRHARFSLPRGLAVTSSWDRTYLLVCDSGHHSIQWGQLPSTCPLDEMAFDTFAGTGFRGHHDGPADTATFHHPCGICVDDTETVYVVDTGNHCIREIRRIKKHVTSSRSGKSTHHWIVSTIAGCSGSGGIRYKAVVKNERGRVSNHASGYADGPGDRARFRAPTGICMGQGSGELLVADTFNHCIRVVCRSNALNAWTVHTIAGGIQSGHLDGGCDAAMFNQPVGICRAGDSSLFVADKGNHCIRHIGGWIGKLKYSWVRTISVGDLAPSWRFSKGVEPPFLLPKGLTVLPPRHRWYSPSQHNHHENNNKSAPQHVVVGVCDTGNHLVRVVSLEIEDSTIFDNSNAERQPKYGGVSTTPSATAQVDWQDQDVWLVATPVPLTPPSSHNQATDELERVLLSISADSVRVPLPPSLSS
ncbi:hypothetical protein DYB28_008237 [Aphanomyces astaci]|uniref:NHL repeat-containing protein n=1 Tax=Aphanomyces astaci TaxID=112090 RepID=A0A9X8DLW9_APHAT|nr:hypothetical protein DYB28_008237 [Aphanomyces astaci]